MTALEIVVFSLGGAIGYYHLGSEYVTSPAYGSLIQPYVKIVCKFLGLQWICTDTSCSQVAGFTLPTLIVRRFHDAAGDYA